MMSVIYDECHLCFVSFMLSATNEHIMLGVIMLNVVMLNIVAPPQQLIIIHINWCFSEVTNSPDNLSDAQRCQYKVNGAKDASLFHQHFHCKFTPYFRLHCWPQLAYFVTFLPNVVPIKIIESYLCKICSALATKMLLKLTSGVICLSAFYLSLCVCVCVCVCVVSVAANRPVFSI